jgi:hypothetical protein
MTIFAPGPTRLGRDGRARLLCPGASDVSLRTLVPRVSRVVGAIGAGTPIDQRTLFDVVSASRTSGFSRAWPLSNRPAYWVVRSRNATQIARPSSARDRGDRGDQTRVFKWTPQPHSSRAPTRIRLRHLSDCPNITAANYRRRNLDVAEAYRSACSHFPTERTSQFGRSMPRPGLIPKKPICMSCCLKFDDPIGLPKAKGCAPCAMPAKTSLRSLRRNPYPAAATCRAAPARSLQ